MVYEQTNLLDKTGWKIPIITVDYKTWLYIAKAGLMNTKRNIYKDFEHPFAQFVRIVGKGKNGARSLTYDEAYQAFSMILKNEVLDIDGEIDRKEREIENICMKLLDRKSVV